MKRVAPRFRGFVQTVLVFMACCTAASTARSEESVVQAKNRILERWTDFESVLLLRKKGPVVSESELERIKSERAQKRLREEASREAFVMKMKRYSMEEVERLEAENSVRNERAEKEKENNRREYLDRRHAIDDLESRIGRIDPSAEYDIDLLREPESKTSWSNQKAAGDSREGF